MKFTTARLCGGKALMAISADEMDLDVHAATDRFRSEGCPVSQEDEMMSVFQWNGMEVTLYRQGKIMFFPLEDKQLCIKYATEILESLRCGRRLSLDTILTDMTHGLSWSLRISSQRPSFSRRSFHWRRTSFNA